MRRLLLVMLLCVMAAGAVSAAEKLTYVDLIKRLTDLEHLSVLPVQGETCAQMSSWDRASQYDAATGKYLNWTANGDGEGLIRQEGEQSVFAEMEGPGCIWRIWSAAVRDGHVKIYLDGSDVPVVDLPWKGYFDRNNAPFIYESLAYSVAEGENCYIPIPYQKSCKIVADKGWGQYYHFNYSTFPKGTIVPTFKRDLSEKETAALKAADDYFMTKLGTDPVGKRKGEQTLVNEVSLGRNSSASSKIKGPSAITCIKIKLDPACDQTNIDVLREVALKISWDGEKKPSVWVPLIDFFGTAPNLNKYKSLPSGVTDDGLYSFWYMPFASEAKVELVNGGESTLPFTISITYAPLTRNIKTLGRFHAKWHRDTFPRPELERWLDWSMLKTEGLGRFCGVAMHLWVPTSGWWGEGDEKFFIDGEKFPSTYGTGSEDYFGYAWGSPALFAKPYHNQTRSDNNAGHVALNRWHITDNIPFRKSFDGYIEKYRSNARPALYSCTSYWYLAPGGSDPYEEVPVSERVGYCIIPPVLTLEGEKIGIPKISGGKAEQHGADGRWSEGSNFVWDDAKPGDELVFTLPVKESGEYELRLRLTKAADYGIFQMLLDGQKAGNPIDLYSSEMSPTEEISLGKFDLIAGDHPLTIQIAGANEQADKKYMFGIDYMKLIPVK